MSKLITSVISQDAQDIIQQADRYLSKDFTQSHPSIRELAKALHLIYFEYRQSEDYLLLATMAILLQAIEVKEIGLDEHVIERLSGETDKDYNMRVRLERLFH